MSLIRRINLLDALSNLINPATEDKQDDIITSQNTILSAIQTKKSYSTGNKTTTPLGIGATFTGDWEDVTNYVQALIEINTDQDSASDGVRFEFSDDGVNVRHAHVWSINANDPDGHHYSSTLDAQYFRIVYTNGAVAHGSFYLATTYFTSSPEEGHVHSVEYTIDADHQASIVRNINVAKTVAGNYVNIGATNSGNLKISLEELENGVSSNSNSQLNTTIFKSDGTELIIYEGFIVNTTKEHYTIHIGNHYFISDIVDLALNAVRDIQITTPDTATRADFTFKIDSENETDLYIYENVTINTAGTSISPINNDRNSANASDLTVAYIDNTSVANANADTDVSGATTISHTKIGAGTQQLGEQKRENEIILKQNTSYSIRLVATTAGYIDYNLRWYEE